MAKLFACMLPVPEATFTPMLPEALLNALPDNEAVLVASLMTHVVLTTVPVNAASRSAVPISS